ncbi:GumC family protein [Pseudomonas huanghezhanensis]|uniref:GumC family protein n=1 Tax=Pseudomonas huanghezhanensis TaxID=3002903 RepID=UPI0022856FB6|nr:polysaccharide biosynthesis tyrosine autokinase [Pseudomonas sp. BSw22131]
MAFTAFVIVVALVAVYSMTPVYRAQATLVMDAKGSKAVSFDVAASTGGDSNASQYMETQAELLQSRTLAERVVRELDLASKPQFDSRAQPKPFAFIGRWLASTGLDEYLPEAVVSKLGAAAEPTEQQKLDRTTRAFMELVTVEPQGKSQLANVMVDMKDPVLAAKAANALSNAFIESQLQTTIGASESATVWMNSRLVELGEKLKGSEARLQAYRESEGLVDVKGVGTISATELSLTSERMIDARRQRAEAESQFRQVQAMGKGGWQKIASVPAVLADPLVQQFKAQEARAKAKVDELAGRYGAKHPAMDAARSDLNAASAALRGQVEQVVAGIERNYQLAAANEGSLQSSFNANKSQIQDISRKEFKLQELQREVDGNRELYDTFMTRLKETTATADIDSANIRVVDPAVVPLSPIKPKKPLILAIAAVLGLFVGALLALLLDALNNTFRSIEQVENHLNIPVVGILPLMARRDRKDLAKTFNDPRFSRFTESIRTIRTNVVLSGYDKPHQVILVTSSVPGEGKTTVSINLAQALGQMEPVLLLDGDLRRPSLAKTLGVSADKPGLSDLITGKATFEQCVVQIDGIDVLCAGSATTNPLELLASQQFAQLLEELKSKYKRIIIDSSPTQVVSDTKVLSTLAQSVIYVVKAGATSIPLTEKGIAQLLQHKAPVRGIVVNQVDVNKANQYGHRFDGFYDYHGYSQKPA